MFDLHFSQYALVSKPWHASASVVGTWIVDLAPCVFNNRLRFCAVGVGYAAHLAVVVKTRTKGAVRQLFFTDLVAVVAVTAIGSVCLVSPCLTRSALGNFFALFEIA